MTTTATTDFVPEELDASSWKNLQPLYRQLLVREMKCSNCLEQLLLDRSELDAAASEAYANLYINQSRRTDDEDIKRVYIEFVENTSPKLKQVGFELDKKIAESPHAADLDQHRFEVMLRDLKTDVELFREENIPLQTEDTKLGQQYGETVGAMMVDFQGEERTLPQMAVFMESTDRQEREGAWRGVAERRHQDHEKMNELLDQMIKIRHQIALNAGFENYRDYIFKEKHRFDYTPADCEEFHLSAEEVCVPLCRKLDTERAKALDVEPLRPWDLGVDVKGRDALKPFDGADDLIEKSSRLFHRMDEGLGDLFDELRTGDCLDLATRKGKAPGGYQWMRDRSRTPFIFMNAAGMQRDLETMVHEAGHAFHSLLSREEPLLHYRHAPLEFAEVASMTMELVSFPYLDAFFDNKTDIQRSIRKNLEGLLSVLPWIATIDAFQHWMYENPEHSHDDRAAKWLELGERFGSDLCWDGLEQHHRVSWQRQLHIFEVPFYYIEYGIAQLGALQLWLNARRDQETAMKRYKMALSLGGSRPLPELFDAAGLTFDFGPEAVRGLIEEVDKELEALPL